MSLESRPASDPTLWAIREAISSMLDTPVPPYEVQVPEGTHASLSSTLCVEIASDVNLIRLGVELDSATQAANGYISAEEAVTFRAEVWRGEVWRDMVSHILHLYDADGQVSSPDRLKPKALFNWRGNRVMVSLYGDTTHIQAWDGRIADEAGLQEAENYLGMLDAANPALYDEARLRAFVDARGIRTFRLKSNNPLLTIPAALHILEQSYSEDPTDELVDLSKTDGEIEVLAPGNMRALSGTLWRIAEDGTIIRSTAPDV